MKREIDFIETLKKLSNNLPNVEYQNGDISDIGNIHTNSDGHEVKKFFPVL